MSTEAVTKIRQLEWKQRFSSEAGECSLGPWLLQAEEQMETPLPNDFKNRWDKCVREALDTVDQTLEGADGWGALDVSLQDHFELSSRQ